MNILTGRRVALDRSRAECLRAPPEPPPLPARDRARAGAGLALAACGGGSAGPTTSTPTTRSTPLPLPASGDGPRAGTDIYRADGSGDLSPVVRGDPALVYVPNSLSNTVDVISQRTMKVVGQFPTGALPQHVTPAWDLKTLYVDNDLGNSLTPINPRTGTARERRSPSQDPYNLYFTPDGRYAIVVAERLQRLDFRDPQHDGADHALLGARVPRRRPHGLLGQRPLHVRQLRVQRADDRRRPAAPSA